MKYLADPESVINDKNHSLPGFMKQRLSSIKQLHYPTALSGLNKDPGLIIQTQKPNRK